MSDSDTPYAETPGAAAQIESELVIQDEQWKRTEKEFGIPVGPCYDDPKSKWEAFRQEAKRYSKEMLNTFKAIKLKDENLWIEFANSFTERTIRALSAAEQSYWIKFLLENGVGIQIKKGYARWKSLAELIHWDNFRSSRQPIAQQTNSSHNPPPFESIDNRGHEQRYSTNQAVRFRENMELPTTPDEPLPQQNRDGNSQDMLAATPTTVTGATPTMQNQIVPRQSNYSLNSLMKAYSNRPKFSGNFTDDFQGCIEQFETLSGICGLSQENMAKGFPIMLTGAAFSHYSRKYAKRNLPYSQLVEEFRAWYTSEEQRYRLLQIWQKPSLSQAMEQQPEKSEVAVFTELADKLIKIQHQLHSSYHEDRFLRDQLLVAADLSHLRTSLVDKIPKTAQEAMQRIAALLSSEPRSAGAHIVNDNEELVMYGLGQRYHGKARKSLSKRKKGSYMLRKALASTKGCWVCHKNHKARDFHSKEEIVRALEKMKKEHPEIVFTVEDMEELKEVWMSYDSEESSDSVIIEDEESAANLIDLTTDQECHRNTEIFFATLSFAHGNSFAKQRSDIENQVSVFTATPCKTFNGVIIDTGANRKSVMCTEQHKAYCNLFQIPLDIDSTEKGGVLGIGGRAKSIGITTLSVPFRELGLVVNVSFRLMETDCPSLLCLNDMLVNGLDISIQEKTMKYQGKTMKLAFENGFLVHKWSPIDLCFSMYTNKELHRLHKVFGHPSVTALSNLLKRANPSEFNSEAKRVLDEITKSCSICMTNANKPRRFKVTVGTEDLKFNHVIAVDIMYIKSKAVLHVVDEATHYTAALFLRSNTAEETWKAILRCWIRIYLGPPDYIRIDQGTNFVAKQFRSSAEAEGISILQAPIESPNTMSHVERYHAPLRVAFNKIRDSLPRSESDSDCLQLAVKSVNDTIGPEGLCPTLLVYGSIPKPPRLGSAETQMARAKALDMALDAVQKEQAKRRVAFALRHPSSPKAKEHEENLNKLPSGSPVLVYRERSRSWEGPFSLVHVEGSTAVIQLPKGRKIFRTTVVKSAKGLSELEKWHPNSDSYTQNNSEYSFVNVPIEMDDDMHDVSEPMTFIFFTDSRRTELRELIKREVFKVVPRKQVPNGTRIYGTRWVDSIKTVDGKTVQKSRIVAQNFRDSGAVSISTRSPTVSRFAQRVAIASAALFPQHKSFVRDISQAYVQSSTTLERDVYLTPPMEMCLPDDMVLKAVKPIYGVPESGLHWFATYHKHHIKQLDMKPCRADICLLYRRKQKDCKGVTALQVDDSFAHGDEKFLIDEEKESIKFQVIRSKPRKLLEVGGSLDFNGCTISLIQNHQHILHQRGKLQDLRKARNAEDFISIRAQLQYIGTCTRPDICAAVQLLASKCENPSQKDIRKLNKIVDWCRETATVGISSIPLDKSDLTLGLFTDASFANACGCKSQLGYVIVLMDGSGRGNILHYGSTRCKRVARSVMAAEIFSLVHGFDQAFIVQSVLEDILGIHVPIDAYLDSRTAFNVVVKDAPTLEKRLQIDVHGLRQSFGTGELRNVYWIAGSSNVADGLTKGMITPDHALWKLMTTNRITLKTEGWVQKSKTSNKSIQ